MRNSRADENELFLLHVFPVQSVLVTFVNCVKIVQRLRHFEAIKLYSYALKNISRDQKYSRVIKYQFRCKCRLRKKTHVNIKFCLR